MPLDVTFPEWGDSRYLDVTLTATLPLRDLLEHLYVLLPVLDDDKHYWVGDDEVEKLLRRGGAWLQAHPERELITRRYLRHDRRLTRDALARLMAVDDDPDDPDADEAAHDAEEAAVERPLSLNEQRMDAVLDALRGAGARTVVDLGCGEGRLVRKLLREPWVDRVVGVDVSWRALEIAARRLKLARDGPAPAGARRAAPGRAHVPRPEAGRLRRGDGRRGDRAPRPAAARGVRAGRVRACAPAGRRRDDAERRVQRALRDAPRGELRHRDHRFEWTRAEFAAWASGVGDRRGYRVEFGPVGHDDPEVGPPTQMAVFTR